MTNILTIELTSAVDCLCDFTYNFFWQHRGTELDPKALIENQLGSSYTFRDLVEHLKSGGDIHIRGGTGSRLASSLGVDLKYFGGGGEFLDVGNIIVDGNVGTRMGISMVAGRMYVSGKVSQPIGNVVEVLSPRKGYRCFRSITDILHNGMENDVFSDGSNSYVDGGVPCLVLADGVLRDTIGARCNRDVLVRVEGDVSLSTGILMRRGIIEVRGNAGMNTGALLSGGTVVVRGDVGEFATYNMRAGNLIITGRSKGYICANMHGGAVFVKHDVKVFPPVKKRQPTSEDLSMLVRILETNQLDAMSYRKYSVF